MTADPTDLPCPSRDRWQPLRAGLVDVFYYDAEEFRFYDGRLLLRGNNGTGKSKVLALTLPFLLDGELTPSRVEPDGDRAKRMEWNLLLGGKHPNDERLGYTWLEFGRLDENGVPQYRTVGCGLKAVKGRGIADHWFFVTDERVGPGLPLRNEHRVSYSRKALEEKIGAHAVFTTAKAYRRAVDEALFGLGAERYEALVNLLIQLRQPQLSKKPDEKLLSKALTEALPPLADGLVGEIAEAFRGLQDERDALAALIEAHGAANAFLAHYRRYAQVAAKRIAAGVRQSHSRYEQLGRDLGAATAAREQAHAAFTTAEGELTELDERQTLLTAQKDAYNRDPAMGTAREIDRLAKAAETLAAVARTRAEDRHRAVRDADSWMHRSEQARQRAQSDAADVDGRHREADAAGQAAGIDHGTLRSVIAAASAQADPPAPPIPSREASEDSIAAVEAAVAVARRSSDALIRDRQQAISGLRNLHQASETAARALAAARAAAERAAQRATASAEHAAASSGAVAARGESLVAAWESWNSHCVETVLPDRDAAGSELELWVRTLDGPNPFARRAEEAGRVHAAHLNRRVADVDGRRTRAEAERSALAAEIARLEQGGHNAPPAPRTRAADARSDRPGAPLWKVVDYQDHVTAADRAGLEAALEASGLLDAWLAPDGRLLDDVTGDVVLAPTAAAPDVGLAAVLRPAIDTADPQAAALEETAVAAVLAAIGGVPVGAAEPGHHTWISPDGRFRVGVLRGAWRKESAHYIGERARETARRARLAELAGQTARLAAEIAALTGEARTVTARLDALAAELREQPSDAALREANTLAAAHADAAREAVAARDEALAAVEPAAEAAAEAVAATLTFAEDTRLPAEAAALEAVAEALADYRHSLSGLWPAVTAAARAAAEAAMAEHERRVATARLAEADEAGLAARHDAEAAAEEHRALVATSGAAVEELYRRLEAVRVELAAASAAATAVRARREQALKDRERAEGRRLQLESDIAEVAGLRDEAITVLRRFTATGLLAAALPDLEHPDPAEAWVPAPAVTLARAIDAALAAVDEADGAWERVQARVVREQQELSGALARHGHQVGMTLQDGLMVVDVLFAGRTQDIPALTSALDAEVAQRTRLLSAKERELLENHLVGEVAGALQELITEAEATVQAMNDDLEARPTSTGMALRLVWRTAKGAPEGLEAIRTRLLRKAVDAWSPADRAAVGDFLARRITDDRAANPADTWHDQLTRAFDYRAWHEFGIQRRTDGAWTSASGPASGGERVLAASVPLFAAASSHYSSGHPHAPRLIALDEAFAGVDDDSRAKCLGLLAAFDLDVVMTSEREWACYPTVPGIGIAQLARAEGVDAVLVTPWRWDGRDRLRLTRPEPYLPPQRARDTPVPTDFEPSLFDD
ncbi:TIGR02680 family protein [Catenulispora acidiphila]|nr:TIGR02680 family protein [Catenulispora acidiphila]